MTNRHFLVGDKESLGITFKPRDTTLSCTYPCVVQSKAKVIPGTCFISYHCCVTSGYKTTLVTRVSNIVHVTCDLVGNVLHSIVNVSHLSMHKLLATIASLLLYTCKADSEATDSASTADAKQANMYPYYYYPSVIYYPYFSLPHPAAEEEGQEAKPFGGDRSDPWLYPPRSYYVHWADTEEQNDWDSWDKWGQWQGWYRRPTASTEPPQ